MGMRMTWLLTVLVLTAALHVNISAQKGYETFNRALAAEKADSDLRGAIRLYERVVREAGKDRQLAARALLRIGECYRRLGDAQARTAFARIVNEYADQTEIVTDARARLEAGGEAAGAVRLAVSLNGSIALDGPVAPDGRVPGTDWSNGDVIFVDAVTRSVSRIAPGGGPGAYPSWGENPLLSPDRRQAAYQWFDDTSGETTNQLRLVSLERGAKPRVLVDDLARVRNIYPSAWSPDARRVLVGYEIPVPAGSSQPAGQGDLQLSWVSVADGTMVPIRRLEWWRSAGANSVGLVSLSPDGRHLAYSAVPAQGSRERSIYVMSIDGADPIEVVKGGVNSTPVWSPDGRQLLFVSDRANTFGIWRIGFTAGKPDGVASAVKTGTGPVQLHGFSAAGVFYYSASTRLDEIFVAPIQEDGRLSARGAPIDSTPGIFPSWSPDGRFLAFKRQRPDRWYDLVVRNTQSGQESKWSQSAAGGPLGDARPVWLGNDRLLAGARTLVEFSAGEFRSSRDIALGPRSVSRDGVTLYQPAGDALSSGGRRRVAVVDLTTAQERSSFEVPNGVTALALNADGDMLAITSPSRVAVVRIDGRDYRELYNGPDVQTPPGIIAWTPDGRSILFTATDARGQSRVMRVPLNGGKPDSIGPDNPLSSGHFDVAPGGTQLAYHTRRNGVELWALELARLKQ